MDKSDNIDFFDKLVPNGLTIRDEANALICDSLRNGPIEKIHEGEYCPILEDQKYSRITQNEMKEIMIYASRKLSEYLLLKEKDPDTYYKMIKLITYTYCKNWEK